MVSFRVSQARGNWKANKAGQPDREPNGVFNLLRFLTGAKAGRMALEGHGKDVQGQFHNG